MPTTLCLGVSHHTAPVALREQLSCSLTDLLAHPLPEAIGEFAILATCNRFELYAVVNESADKAKRLLIQLLAQLCGLEPAKFANHLFSFTDDEANEHLLNVAAGLDSLVLGEAQILGQVRQAYVTAVTHHTLGPILDTLFKAAIRTGKRTHTETNISSNPASISSVAIALAQQQLGSLQNRQILVVGAGEMGRSAIKSLRLRGLSQIAVANRTIAHAQSLVAPWGGTAYSLSQLPEAIAEADVVITAVHTPTPIINPTTISSRQRPLILIDLAVPRNIAPSVAHLPHVQLFDIDNLQTNLDDSLTARQAEIPAIQAIIASETASLQEQLRQLSIKPLIIDMRRQAEAIRQAELERTLRHLGQVDPQTWQHIQHLSRALVNKLLHEPTARLRQKASDEAYTAAVRDLFGLGN